MQCYKITFSPTGGTEKVAEILTRTLGYSFSEIDLLDRQQDFSRYEYKKEDVCLFAVPSFGGRVPQTAAERILQMKGNGARAVLAVVYGNRAYEDTVIELQDTVRQAGFTVIAAVAAVAEHSIMRQFAQGRPDAADQRELEAYGAKIRRILDDSKESARSEEGMGILSEKADTAAEINDAGKENETEKEKLAEKTLEVPGTHPYRTYNGVPMKPKAGRACDRCGLCAAKCPVGAIPSKQPNQTLEDVCITCMRCVKVCPRGARSCNPLMVKAASLKMKRACQDRKKNEFWY